MMAQPLVIVVQPLVGNVGQPNEVRRRRLKLLRQQVWGDRQMVPAVGCGGTEPPPGQSPDAMPAHQPGDTPAAAGVPVGAECGVHPRTAITAMMLGLDAADLAQQL